MATPETSLTKDHLATLRYLVTDWGSGNSIGDAAAWAITEIEALRLERHQLRNELTAARLENEGLRNQLRVMAALGDRKEAERTLAAPEPYFPAGARRVTLAEMKERYPSSEPNPLSDEELNAALPAVSKCVIAEVQHYSKLSPKDFADLAWNTLTDAAWEHTTMLYELCSRVSPEWVQERKAATPQKSGGGQ